MEVNYESDGSDKTYVNHETYDCDEEHSDDTINNEFDNNKSNKMSTDANKKLITVYSCDDCSYETKYKHHMDRHMQTEKHYKNVNRNNKTKYTCICGKSYNHKSGLCKHKHKCSVIKNKKENLYCEYGVIDKNDVIMKLIQQNHEFKQLILEQTEHIIKLASKNGSECNNNSITNNNQFNLNMFLNVTCKDAMNMTDFINSIEINLEDLEITGKIGYVDGISKIFIDRLKELHVHNRPMYCSDSRREIIYIKDNDVWEEETGDRKRLKQAINEITHKNMGLILVWKQHNPGCDNPQTSSNNVYLKIVSNSMNGLTKEETDRNYNRIISKVAREMAIPKDLV